MYEWIDPWEALETAHQALREVDHAHRSGERWFTRGELGLRQHVRTWIDKGLDALAGLPQKNPDTEKMAKIERVIRRWFTVGFRANEDYLKEIWTILGMPHG